LREIRGVPQCGAPRQPNNSELAKIVSQTVFVDSGNIDEVVFATDVFIREFKAFGTVLAPWHNA
jgi:hypothetical protein